jgi:hypothetical protein
VGGIKYVRAEQPAHTTGRWVAAWRHRKAAAAPRILPLAVADNVNAAEGSEQ